MLAGGSISARGKNRQEAIKIIMKVKEILIMAAGLLGQDELRGYLENGVCHDISGCEEECDMLLSAYNAALHDVAADFAPLIHTFVAENAAEVNFSALEDIPTELVSVCDENGDPLFYERAEDRITFKSPVPKVVVKYVYLPYGRKLTDEFDYGYFDKITPRAISLGAAAEYLRMKGAKVQANEMQKRFDVCVRSCVRPKGKLVLPKRRWN